MRDFRRPHLGNYMRWQGCVWVIRQNLHDTVTVEVEETGRIEQMKVSAWMQACSDGTIAMVSDPTGEVPEDRRDLAKVPFAALSKTQQDAVETKRRYIEAFLDPNAFYSKHMPHLPEAERIIPVKLGRKKVVPFLGHVASTFKPAEKPPGFSTFDGWMGCWQRYKDWRMMAPRFDRRGPNERSVIVGPVAEMVDAAVKAWLTPNQAPIADMCADVALRLAKWNAAHPDKPPLRVSDRQLYRYVEQEVDRKDVALARKGAEWTKAHYKPVWKGPEPEHVMEEVEVDHTQAETEVCDDETGYLLGRPWITAAFDRCSRMLVGLHLHFEGQTQFAAMQALKNAMMPKGFLKKLVPRLGYDYPCCGVPVAFFFDRGADFDSDHIREVGLNFDIRIDYAPGEQPEFKAKLERFFRTCHEQTALNVKGAMPRVPKRASDRRPETSNATMTFSDFYERLWTWVATVYARDFHEGISAVPLERWNASAALRPPRAPPPRSDVDKYLMRAERCAATVRGVRVGGLAWQGSAIEDIRRAPSFRRGDRVLVRIDDSDVSKAYVTHPTTGELIGLRPLLPEYMRGLSMFNHELVKRNVGATRNRAHSEKELLEAKAHLREEALLMLSAKTTGSKTRARIARSLGVGALAPVEDGLGSLAPQPQDRRADEAVPAPPAAETPMTASFDEQDDDDNAVREVPDR